VPKIKERSQLIEKRIQDLHENTNFVSALFNQLVGYAIIAADFDGNVLAYNEGARLIYGYSVEEVIGLQKFESFFPSEFIEAGKLQDLIAELIEGGSVSYEGEKVRKNGDRFPSRAVFTLTKDKLDKVAGFIEIVEDLTEQRETEQAQAEAWVNQARIEQLEHEIRAFERITGSTYSNVTARALGLRPLREAQPDSYASFLQHYETLLDLTLEQRIYRVDQDISENLSSMAEELGRIRAGPRDVVEIHSNALKQKTNESNVQKSKAYIEEGRFMVLELMGRLLDYYRRTSQAVGFENNFEQSLEKNMKERKNG